LAEPRDAAGVLEIYAPYCESSSVSFEIVAPTAAQMSERIQRILAKYPWLICEIDGKVAGYVYASQHRERAAYRWAVEVAAYVATDYHRRGIAQTLYKRLFSILRVQNYFKAFAGITLPNAASVRLHESVGFRPVAVYRGIGHKDGNWLDVGWWQLELQREVENPPEPVPFETLRNSDSVTAALDLAEALTGPGGTKDPGSFATF
jgi:phosphinothricin acetyltransferase